MIRKNACLYCQVACRALRHVYESLSVSFFTLLCYGVVFHQQRFCIFVFDGHRVRDVVL